MRRKQLNLPEAEELGKAWLGFPGGSEVKASAYNAGDLGWIPGSGRSPGESNGNPLQYSCLDGGAWWATIHGVAKSRTRLNDFTFTLLLPPDISTTVFHFHFGPAASFFLELLLIALCSSPLAYWTLPTLGTHLPGSYIFAFSYCSWGSCSKYTRVSCHFLL